MPFVGLKVKSTDNRIQSFHVAHPLFPRFSKFFIETINIKIRSLDDSLKSALDGIFMASKVMASKVIG